MCYESNPTVQSLLSRLNTSTPLMVPELNLHLLSTPKILYDTLAISGCLWLCLDLLHHLYGLDVVLIPLVYVEV